MSSLEILQEQEQESKLKSMIYAVMHKLSQIIVYYRTDRTFNDREKSRSFALTLPERPEIKQTFVELEQKHPGEYVSLRINCHFEKTPVESWHLSFLPLHDQVGLKRINIHTVYKHFVILCRAIASICTLLPSYAIRKSIICTVWRSDQPESSITFDSSPANAHFSPVVTNIGKVQATVFYSRSVPLPVNRISLHSSSSESSPLFSFGIIHDYVEQRSRSVPISTHSPSGVPTSQSFSPLLLPEKEDIYFAPPFSSAQTDSVLGSLVLQLQEASTLSLNLFHDDQETSVHDNALIMQKIDYFKRKSEELKKDFPDIK